jgi:hypothetical protein
VEVHHSKGAGKTGTRLSRHNQGVKITVTRY